MLKKYLLVLLIGCSCISLSAQTSLERIYGEAKPVNALPYLNGYLLFLWERNPLTPFDYTTNVIRTDEAGDTIWVTSFHGSKISNGIVDSNSGITVLQSYDSLGYVPLMQMSQVDSSGNILSDKLIVPFNPQTDTSRFIGTALCRTHDSGYLITGYWDSLYYYRRFIIKTDSLFNTIGYFSDDLGEAQSNTGNIIETSSKDILVYAHLGYGGASTPFSELVKLDSSFNVIWHQYFDNCQPNSIYEDDNGNYVITGSRAEPMTGPPAPYHGFVTRLDTAGNILWRQTDSVDFLVTCRGANNGIVVAGYVVDYFFPHDTLQIFIRAYDSTGVFLFNRFFNPSYQGYPVSIHNISDSAFVLCGFVDTILSGTYNPVYPYLIVTDYDQSILAYTPEVKNNILHVYPNPASNKIYIDYKEKEISVKLIDITGKIILNKFSEDGITSFDIGSQPDGFYIIRIDGTNESICKKVLISR